MYIVLCFRVFAVLRTSDVQKILEAVESSIKAARLKTGEVGAHYRRPRSRTLSPHSAPLNIRVSLLSGLVGSGFYL